MTLDLILIIIKTFKYDTKRKSSLINYLLKLGINIMSLNGSKTFVKHTILKKFDTTLKTCEEVAFHIILKASMKLNDEALNKIMKKSNVNTLFHKQELLIEEIKNTLIEYDVCLKKLRNIMIHH